MRMVVKLSSSLAKQALNEGGATAEITDEEHRRFNFLLFVSTEEDIVEDETDMGQQLVDGHNRVPQQHGNAATTRHLAIGSFRLEPGAITQACENGEVEGHR